MLVPSLRPGAVHAFSEPKIYGDPPSGGGAGGRWFTGSPADGYGCKVCHTGRGSLPLYVDGLPTAGYVPGTDYIIKLAWPEVALRNQQSADLGNRPNTTLVAEFVSEDGSGSGTLTLEPSRTSSTDLCTAQAGEQPRMAATLFEQQPDGKPPTESQLCAANSLGHRCVLATRSCGSSTLRVRWTAPPQWRGPIWFSAGFVTTDAASGAPNDDDFVTELEVPMNAASDGAPYDTTLAGGCSVLRASSSDAGCGLALWLVAAGLLRMRKRVANSPRSRRLGKLASATLLLLSGCQPQTHVGTRGTASTSTSTSTSSNMIGLFTPDFHVDPEPTGAAASGPAGGNGGASAAADIMCKGTDITIKPSDDDAGVKDTDCKLSIELTTGLTRPGEYDKNGAQENGGIVWIENEQGEYVGALDKWTTKYPLVWSQYQFQSMRVFCPEGPDVIAEPTVHAHITHKMTWSCRDLRGRLVPDGNYKLWVEVQVDEKRPSLPPVTVPFPKGPDAWTKSLPPMSPYTTLTLSYTPIK